MDDRAKNRLADLYKKEGERITNDAQTCEALLREACVQCRKEIAVLSGAVKCGIPAEIAANLSSMPPHLLRERLITTMEEDGGFERNAAGWAVDTWRSVLEGSKMEDSKPVKSSKPANEQGAKDKSNELADFGSQKQIKAATGQLPPPEAVTGAFHGRRSRTYLHEAQQYVRKELLTGKRVEAVRDNMVQHGYPKVLAEAVIWTASLSQKREKLMKEAMGAFGVAVVLIVASTIVGARAGEAGAVATLGGWATAFLVIFGCVRLLSAFSVPNFATSHRQVLASKQGS